MKYSPIKFTRSTKKTILYTDESNFYIECRRQLEIFRYAAVALSIGFSTDDFF